MERLLIESSWHLLAATSVSQNFEHFDKPETSSKNSDGGGSSKEADKSGSNDGGRTKVLDRQNASLWLCEAPADEDAHVLQGVVVVIKVPG